MKEEITEYKSEYPSRTREKEIRREIAREHSLSALREYETALNSELGAWALKSGPDALKPEGHEFLIGNGDYLDEMLANTINPDFLANCSDD